MKQTNIIITILLSVLMLACSQTENENPESETNTDNKSSAAHSFTDSQVKAIENAVFYGFDGNEYKLADFRGKTVLIDFWETWCAPCISTMPALDKLMKDYEDDFVVLATSPLWTDDEENVKRFIDNNDYSFYYVHANELSNSLTIRGIPYKIYIAPDGSIYKDESGSRGAERDYQVISEIIEKLRS